MVQDLRVAWLSVSQAEAIRMWSIDRLRHGTPLVVYGLVVALVAVGISEFGWILVSVIIHVRMVQGPGRASRVAHHRRRRRQVRGVIGREPVVWAASSAATGNSTRVMPIGLF